MKMQWLAKLSLVIMTLLVMLTGLAAPAYADSSLGNSTTIVVTISVQSVLQPTLNSKLVITAGAAGSTTMLGDGQRSSNMAWQTIAAAVPRLVTPAAQSSLTMIAGLPAKHESKNSPKTNSANLLAASLSPKAAWLTHLRPLAI